MSIGGPLALAALVAPGVLADASGSAGIVMVAAVVVFAAPLAIWLRYARHVPSAGGLYAFTEAAAGRRVALVQAGLWIISYALYLVYTTAQIVYEVLPVVLPGLRPIQPLLEIAIPVALAGVMIAGRRATFIVAGVLAVGQLAIAAALGGVTVANLGAPAASFGASAPAGSLASATAQTALLYACASLPLFLGGEVARPAVTMRRGLITAYVVTAAVVIAAVFPLAAAPMFAGFPIPGVSVANRFAGHDFAVAVGIGVAASIAGVILAEYIALGRLLHAMTARSLRSINIVIGAIMVAAAPLMLINPVRLYDDLVQPSIVALLLSNLIVFAVYPRFAARHSQGKLGAWALTIVAAAFTVYGLWTTISQVSS
jgi:amino acid transporter